MSRLLRRSEDRPCCCPPSLVSCWPSISRRWRLVLILAVILVTLFSGFFLLRSWDGSSIRPASSPGLSSLPAPIAKERFCSFVSTFDKHSFYWPGFLFLYKRFFFSQLKSVPLYFFGEKINFPSATCTGMCHYVKLGEASGECEFTDRMLNALEWMKENTDCEYIYNLQEDHFFVRPVYSDLLQQIVDSMDENGLLGVHLCTAAGQSPYQYQAFEKNDVAFYFENEDTYYDHFSYLRGEQTADDLLLKTWWTYENQNNSTSPPPFRPGFSAVFSHNCHISRLDESLRFYRIAIEKRWCIPGMTESGIQSLYSTDEDYLTTKHATTLTNVMRYVHGSRYWDRKNFEANGKCAHHGTTMAIGFIEKCWDFFKEYGYFVQLQKGQISCCS